MYKKLILFTCMITLQSTLSPSYQRSKRIPDRVSNKALGITPLHCVTSIQQAAEIIYYGPDINAQTNEGFTPIQCMIYDKRFDIACYLQKQGARVTKNEIQQISTYKKYNVIKTWIVINSFMYLTAVYVNSK